MKCSNPGVQLSNNGGWQSQGFGYQHNLFLKSLIDTVLKNVSEVYKDLGISKVPLLGDYWFNVNSKHSFNVSHTHPGSYISAVFYVKVPDNSGRLIFERPDDFHNWIHDIDPNSNNIGKIIQQPHQNLLIMFPSYIRHSVEMNQSDEDRISIAFNFR